MTMSRWGGFFGVLAAVLLVAAVLISGETPAGDAPAQEWTDYIQDSDTALVVRAYLLIGASLSLFAFYAFGVRPRLGDAESSDRALGQMGAGATLLGSAALAVGGLIGAAVAAANKFGDVPIDPSLASTFDNFVYGFLLLGGAIPFAVVMAVVAIQSRRRKAFPTWVLWVSVVAIIGMATSLIFLPFVLLPVWLIAVSVAVFRGGERRTA